MYLTLPYFLPPCTPQMLIQDLSVVKIRKLAKSFSLRNVLFIRINRRREIVKATVFHAATLIQVISIPYP